MPCCRPASTFKRRRTWGQWVDVRAITRDQLTGAMVARFARHHCRCPHSGAGGRPPSRRYVARVQRFVECLQVQGVAPRVPVAPQLMPAPLVGFREWMLRHRGLAPSTIERYELSVIRMMPALGDDSSVDHAALIRRCFLTHINGMTRAYAKCFASALRVSAVSGERESVPPVFGSCGADHSGVASVRVAAYLRPPMLTASSPRAHRTIPAASGIVRSCCYSHDLASARGCRQDDIRRSRLVCKDGAGAREEWKEVRLPLPQDVGDAIPDYLDRARPSTTIPRVFLCANAPVRAFPTPTVSNIVALALRRAGIADPPSRGAHLLRHSAATAMLRAGAGLDAIAAVLRHASTDTTAHYAKVDLGLLSSVVQPWPEEVSDAH